MLSNVKDADGKLAHGIYQVGGEEFVLYIKGDFKVVSCVRQDCVNEARSLGYNFN